MANGEALLDLRYPDLGNCAGVERKLEAVQSYLFLLQENLRYLLRNLSPENFNEAEVARWISDTVEVPAVITDELYSDYGAIADLVVNELRTDTVRAQNYLDGDPSPIDYLHVRDEEIDFLTGTVRLDANDEPLTEQLHHGDRYFWWTDASRTKMTSLEETAWPVVVYQYDELLKGTLRFDTATQGGQTVRVPQLILGAGYGYADPDRGRGFLRKNPDSFDLWLLSASGVRNGMFIGDDYTDLAGLRKPTSLDFSGWSGGSFSETLDGGVINAFSVSFDQSGRPVSFTDGDGHVTAVSWGAAP